MFLYYAYLTWVSGLDSCCGACISSNLWFGVWGFGFAALGLGLRGKGLGFRAYGSGFRVEP